MVKLKKGKYQHFKGNFYEVLGIGKHSETSELYVVYKPLYDSPYHTEGVEYSIRPKEMFLETVERDGKKIKRFKYIG